MSNNVLYKICAREDILEQKQNNVPSPSQVEEGDGWAMGSHGKKMSIQNMVPFTLLVLIRMHKSFILYVCTLNFVHTRAGLDSLQIYVRFGAISKLHTSTWFPKYSNKKGLCQKSFHHWFFL